MRRGFTLIELLVVIAIIAILAAILFPVFAKAREKAKQASCLSNCKQIGLGLMMYTQDYNEYLVPATGPAGGFVFQLNEYLKQAPYYTAAGKINTAWLCPTGGVKNALRFGNYYVSYAINTYASVPTALKKLSRVKKPSLMAHFMDANPTGLGNMRIRDFDTGLVSRHTNGCNVLFVDAHVEYRNRSEQPFLPIFAYPYSNDLFWDQP